MDGLFNSLKRKCARCGKEFILTCGARGWLYKRRADHKPQYFCGWNCMVAAEKEYAEKRLQEAKHEKDG